MRENLDRLGLREDQVIFTCLHGSHLYGTDTESSDEDIKGVYIEDMSRIVLGTAKRHLQLTTGKSHTKNSAEDVDIDFIELRQFIADALSGQPYAIDMLFCNKKCTITTSKLWKSLVENRKKMLSQNVAPFIGYCRHQAAKYGLKGSRLAALDEVLAVLESTHPLTLVKDVKFKFGEFVKLVEVDKRGNGPFVQVLGKKFMLLSKSEAMRSSLSYIREKYGDRTKLAKENKGIDWKAISHAYRVMFQVQDLLQKQKIVFPLKEAKYLKRIKAGTVPWEKVNEELPVLMNMIEKIATISKLPEKPDREFFNQFILSHYLGKDKSLPAPPTERSGG